MVDEEDGVIGYAMFSRFPIEGKYEEDRTGGPPPGEKAKNGADTPPRF